MEALGHHLTVTARSNFIAMSAPRMDHRAEAEKLLAQLRDSMVVTRDDAFVIVQRAQAHALLAHVDALADGDRGANRLANSMEDHTGLFSELLDALRRRSS